MTDKLDLSAVALRRDPYTRFGGPFIGPDKYGWIRAIVDNECRSWRASDGSAGPNHAPHPTDLVPLQQRPLEWLRCWGNDCGQWGVAYYDDEITAKGCIGTATVRVAVPMIECAAGDALADAAEAYLLWLVCLRPIGLDAQEREFRQRLHAEIAKWRSK